MPIKKKDMGSEKKDLLIKAKEKGFAIGKDILLMALAGVLLVAIGGLGGYFLNKKINQKEVIVDNNPPIEDSEIFDNEPTEEEIVETIDKIEWNEPEEIENLKFFEEENISKNEQAKYYKVGTIIDEKYKDGEIILVRAMPESTMYQPIFYRFIRQDGNFFLLKKYSVELYDGDGLIRSKFNIDEDYTISSLEYPKFIYGDRPRQILEEIVGLFGSNTNEFFTTKNLKLVFEDEKLGNVYTTKSVPVADQQLTIFDKYGFYLRAPDGTVKVYAYKPDFIDKDGVPEITWSSGEKNKERYNYADSSGCGSLNFISVVDEETRSGLGLEEIGKNSKGDKIYGIASVDDSLLKETYKRSHTIFDGAEAKEVSYEEFIASRPLIFWEDPFGRLIKLEIQKFAPLAECGKPVIYLYPEETTKISVKVEPKGGMSYSDPEYNNGWEVISDTNSNITELRSGKVYPYLFWEGRGGIYESPKNGFVIKKEEVHSFLVEKLAKFGLNKKETADFIEFWEPRMQSAPYYFVGFLGNDGMNQLAPLTIDPKPDTVIRILMDFSPLEKPINVRGYDIRTPERKGFTVVEWGGVLR